MTEPTDETLRAMCEAFYAEAGQHDDIDMYAMRAVYRIAAQAEREAILRELRIAHAESIGSAADGLAAAIDRLTRKPD